MMSRTKIVSVLFLVVTLTLSASAFTTSNGNGIISKSNHQVGHGSMRVCSSSSAPISTRTSNTALSERRWNFNEGQSPWGLKKNAEIWNGRMAQVCPFLLFLFNFRLPPPHSFCFIDDKIGEIHYLCPCSPTLWLALLRGCRDVSRHDEGNSASREKIPPPPLRRTSPH